jgi:hypothetical protein
MIKYVILKCRNCDHHRSLFADEFPELLGQPAAFTLKIADIRAVLDRAICSSCRSKAVVANVDGHEVYPTGTISSKPQAAKQANSPAMPLIRRMLSKPNWISGRDLQFLMSVAKQARISEKQEKAIRRMYDRYQRNQGPKFFRG